MGPHIPRAAFRYVACFRRRQNLRAAKVFQQPTQTIRNASKQADRDIVGRHQPDDESIIKIIAPVSREQRRLLAVEEPATGGLNRCGIDQEIDLDATSRW